MIVVRSDERSPEMGPPMEPVTSMLKTTSPLSSEVSMAKSPVSGGPSKGSVKKKSTMLSMVLALSQGSEPKASSTMSM